MKEMTVRIDEAMLMPGCVAAGGEGEEVRLRFPKDGSGVDLTWLKDKGFRYVVLTMTAHTDHSAAFWLGVYTKDEPDVRAFDIQTGVLPGVPTRIVLDLGLMDAHALFPETAPGQLKITCHGRRINPAEIGRIALTLLPFDEETEISFSPLTLTDEYPDHFDVADGKLIDELGQWKGRSWKTKLSGEEELKEVLSGEAAEADSSYPFDDWSRYGGFMKLRLGEGTGFFTRTKKDGRWWLVDPDGYAFFSMGPDCVNLDADCRIDGIEKWMDWLPDPDDPDFAQMYEIHEKWPPLDKPRRKCTLFSFPKANLYRAFGKNWYEEWQRLIPGQLKKYGMNTIANWSDPVLFGAAEMPYVTSLARFPETSVRIFRDFPDVFSREYEESAAKNAEALRARKDDPFMIGYFLRNEPSWAFVDNLVIADEVLYNPERSACKEELIRRLKERYGTVEELNEAWNSEYGSFDGLYESREHTSAWSAAAEKELREFSAEMVRRYVEIPAKACRAVDPNHMILGMRWAWISDPALVEGWENFDVFSINCYSFDPTPAIDNVRSLGVDLPVMIGEFHFGALDAGPLSTGLKAVADQAERGKAYRYYVEKTAEHPMGVGCHYFQLYDQFALGRFDGENYNIGLFDLTSRPYPDMLEAIRECSAGIRGIAAGERNGTAERAAERCVVAF